MATVNPNTAHTHSSSLDTPHGGEQASALLLKVMTVPGLSDKILSNMNLRQVTALSCASRQLGLAVQKSFENLAPAFHKELSDAPSEIKRRFRELSVNNPNNLSSLRALVNDHNQPRSRHLASLPASQRNTDIDGLTTDTSHLIRNPLDRVRQTARKAHPGV